MEQAVEMKTIQVEDQLQTLLVQLARARRDATAHKAICDTMLQEVKDSPDYQHADDARRRFEELTRQLEEQVRGTALAGYVSTLNKHPLPGVEIKEMTEATCTDTDAARSYAINNAPGVIKIDWTALGKIATALSATAAPLPFYKVEKVAKAQIATNLDKTLLEQGLPF